MRLVFDAERRDVYGRLLAYVYTQARGSRQGPLRQRGSRPPGLRANAGDRAQHRTRAAASPAPGTGRQGRAGPVGRLLSAKKRSRSPNSGSFKRLRAPRLPSGPRGTLAPSRASSGTAMRMRQTSDQFELAFEQEAALERRRRTQLRQRAANRSRARRMQRTEQRGNVAFGVLVVALTLTVVDGDRGDVRDAGLADELGAVARSPPVLRALAASRPRDRRAPSRPASSPPRRRPSAPPGSTGRPPCGTRARRGAP